MTEIFICEAHRLLSKRKAEVQSRRHKGMRERDDLIIWIILNSHELLKNKVDMAVRCNSESF